jgi:ABC-2 type transport system permease protein
MKKIFLIGFKDLTLIFRDPAALVLMLLAPFVLTIGLGFVTGRLGNSTSSGISDIPVILVNQDQAQLGNTLVGMFQSSDLKGLVAPTLMDDFSAAQAQVDENKAAAAILIPDGFSGSIIPNSDVTTAGSTAAAVPTDVVTLQLYANPTSPTSVGVVKTLLENFLTRVETSRVSGQVTIEQMLSSGIIQPAQAQTMGAALGAQLTAASTNNSTSITIDTQTKNGNSFKVDTLAMLAPGMALMFLMYTVTYGGRSLLAERKQGTLPRLLVSPTSSAQVLGGKVFGIFLTGMAQMLILVIGTSLLFKLQWGDPLAVFVLIAAAVAAATGWGLLLAAAAKTTGQISSIGSAMMLIFGILGGSFFSMQNLPTWVQIFSHISPNAWGMDGFTTLALGNGISYILTPILALLGMAAVLFTVSVLIINRRGFAIA